MARLVFFNIPAHGHINPALPLTAELVRRGHDVTWFITERFRSRVETTGARVALYPTITDDYFEQKRLNGTEPQRAALALLETTRDVLPALIERMERERPDAILHDCMCPWGYHLAKVLKLPAVSSFSLMPLSMGMMRDLRTMRLVLPGVIRDLRLGMRSDALARALGRTYGIRRLGSLEVLNARGDVNISYSSPEFVPFAETLTDPFTFVGWTLNEGQPDPVFAHDGRLPLVYISLGTVSNDNPAFFRACITAFTGARCRVMISTGGGLDPEAFGPLPDNITLHAWVPQSQVLRQAAVFVTHGGVNSLQDGLYCGLPLLIVPQQVEQTMNGLRAVDLGAALMLRPDAVTAEALRQCVDRLLREPGFREAAAAIGRSLHRGGAAAAANAVEGVL